MAAIMRVPLFIKAPGQREGRISDRKVETVDILPTMAQMLQIKIPWQVDGVSAFDSEAKDRTHRVIYWQGPGSAPVRAEIPEGVVKDRDDALQRKLALFGAGGSNDKLYLIGPNNHLIGRPVSSFVIAAADDSAPTLSLKPVAGTKNGPWAVTGKLKRSRESAPTHNLAIAVDGTVCSVTRSYVNSSVDSVFVAFLGPICQYRKNSLIQVLHVSDSTGSPAGSRFILL
jgi:hypothetical protein